MFGFGFGFGTPLCPVCGEKGPYTRASDDDPLVSIMHHDVGETSAGKTFPVYQCQACYHLVQPCEQCRRNLVSLTRYGRTCDPCLEKGRFPNPWHW